MELGTLEKILLLIRDLIKNKASKLIFAKAPCVQIMGVIAKKTISVKKRVVLTKQTKPVRPYDVIVYKLQNIVPRYLWVLTML